eukprot:4630988-Prymnesium_polylepis.1
MPVDVRRAKPPGGAVRLREEVDGEHVGHLAQSPRQPRPRVEGGLLGNLLAVPEPAARARVRREQGARERDEQTLALRLLRNHPQRLHVALAREARLDARIKVLDRLGVEDRLVVELDAHSVEPSRLEQTHVVLDAVRMRPSQPVRQVSRRGTLPDGALDVEWDTVGEELATAALEADARLQLLLALLRGRQ